MKNPLVSCLMVSKPTTERFRLFERSLRGYLAQTYKNRELIIVTSHLSSEEWQAVGEHIRCLTRRDIRIRFVPGNPSLGRLRNISFDLAAGSLCCQWDDDDIYHPRRIELQVKAMLGARKGEVFLQTLMHFFERERALFVEDWGRLTPPYNCHPGTGLVLKDPEVRYPTRGQHARKGEDTVFFERHQERHGRILVRDYPYLYVYVYHSLNTWSFQHHRGLAVQNAWPRKALLRMRKEIESRLQELDLPPGPINVLAKDGPAFIWRKSKKRRACRPRATGA